MFAEDGTSTKSVPTKVTAKATAKLPADKPKRRRCFKIVPIVVTIVNHFQSSMNTCFFDLNESVSSSLYGESRPSRVSYGQMTDFGDEQSRTHLIALSQLIALNRIRAGRINCGLRGSDRMIEFLQGPYRPFSEAFLEKNPSVTRSSQSVRGGGGRPLSAPLFPAPLNERFIG
jgi:hypothetical protein